MDKKVFLVNRECYTKELLNGITEKDLEEWVAEEDYDDDYSIIKLDANDYDTPDDAIKGELGSIIDVNDYYIFNFGF